MLRNTKRQTKAPKMDETLRGLVAGITTELFLTDDA
jgi:hypothetical protein